MSGPSPFDPPPGDPSPVPPAWPPPESGPGPGPQPAPARPDQHPPPPGHVPADTLGRPLASWSQRVVALVVDLVVAGFLAGALVAAASTPDIRSLPGGGYQVVWTSGTVTATLLFFLLLTAYFTFANGSRAGQTAGKALVGIAVRDAAGGGQIGAARGLARSAVTGALWYLAIVPWVLDGLWPLWDPRRQALHDRIAGSVVVRVR